MQSGTIFLSVTSFWSLSHSLTKHIVFQRTNPHSILSFCIFFDRPSRNGGGIFYINNLQETHSDQIEAYSDNNGCALKVKEDVCIYANWRYIFSLLRFNHKNIATECAKYVNSWSNFSFFYSQSNYPAKISISDLTFFSSEILASCTVDGASGMRGGRSLLSFLNDSDHCPRVLKTSECSSLYEKRYVTIIQLFHRWKALFAFHTFFQHIKPIFVLLSLFSYVSYELFTAVEVNWIQQIQGFCLVQKINTQFLLQ